MAYLVPLVRTMERQFDLLINSYMEHQLGVAPLFLNAALCNGLRSNIAQLQKDAMMMPAGIGNDLIRNNVNQTRNDQVYWLDKTHENVFEAEFLLLVDDFIAYLNRTCYTGINGSEFHYAVYETGSYYKRHKDQFKNDSNRKFSLVAYLNQQWVEEDGGQLWIHREDEIQKILPHEQTAVFFNSEETEHEVTMAHRSRMSISGWLKRV